MKRTREERLQELVADSERRVLQCVRTLQEAKAEHAKLEAELELRQAFAVPRLKKRLPVGAHAAWIRDDPILPSLQKLTWYMVEDYDFETAPVPASTLQEQEQPPQYVMVDRDYWEIEAQTSDDAEPCRVRLRVSDMTSPAFWSLPETRLAFPYIPDRLYESGSSFAALWDYVRTHAPAHSMAEHIVNIVVHAGRFAIDGVGTYILGKSDLLRFACKFAH